MPPDSGGAKPGSGGGLVEDKCVGILLGSRDRAEGLGKSPVQRPSCVDISGPDLQRLWDFQRDEQLGDEVSKMAAGTRTDPVCLHVGLCSQCSPVHLHSLPFVKYSHLTHCVCVCGGVPVRMKVVPRKGTPIRPSPVTFLN